MQYSIQLASAHSSPVSTKVHFLSWFFFFFEIFHFHWYPNADIFLPVSSLWALTRECISLLLYYLDTKPLPIAAQPWKVFCFSAGEPSEPGEDIPMGVIPENSEVVLDGTLTDLWLPQHFSGSSFHFLCLYNFLPWVEDQAPWNGVWHFPGRWDTWTQVAVSQVRSSSWYPF